MGCGSVVAVVVVVDEVPDALQFGFVVEFHCFQDIRIDQLSIDQPQS